MHAGEVAHTPWTSSIDRAKHTSLVPSTLIGPPPLAPPSQGGGKKKGALRGISATKSERIHASRNPNFAPPQPRPPGLRRARLDHIRSTTRLPVRRPRTAHLRDRRRPDAFRPVRARRRDEASLTSNRSDHAGSHSEPIMYLVDIGEVNLIETLAPFERALNLFRLTYCRLGRSRP